MKKRPAGLGDFIPPLFCCSPWNFAPIEALQRAGKWNEAGAILAASAKRLEKAGAGVIGLATNTMHIVAAQVVEGISTPFIHIADPTADALAAKNFRRVGLLGTRFTMEMSFYKDRLKVRGLDVLVPEQEIPALNAIIYEEMCHGVVRDASRQIFVNSIQS